MVPLTSSSKALTQSRKVSFDTGHEGWDKEGRKGIGELRCNLSLICPPPQANPQDPDPAQIPLPLETSGFIRLLYIYIWRNYVSCL